MNFELSRLDKAIRRLYGKNIPQSIIERGIREKNILVNGKRATSASMRVSEISDDIHVDESLFTKENNETYDQSLTDKFEKLIVYEDQNIVAINKPAGLATQLGTNTSTAVDIMAKSYNPDARLVHRIDKQTSGLVVLSKNLVTSRYMLHLFKTNGINKRYIAIISDSNLHNENGYINVPLSRQTENVIVDKTNGKEAITEYSLVKRMPDNLAMIEVRPKTGRTHQIRVHMKYIGCPIYGDSKYGGRKNKFLCLHAQRIYFKSMSGEKMKIEAPLPDYFPEI